MIRWLDVEHRRGGPVAAQATALGAAIALLAVSVVPAFLVSYGASSLPLVFLGLAALAVAGQLVRSAIETRLGRSRFSASAWDLAALGFLTVAVGLVWSLLTGWGIDWASVAGVLLLGVTTRFGVGLLRRQTGSLADRVRQSLVFGGMSAGAVVAGLVSFPLTQVFGRPEHLAAGGSVALWALATLLARRRLPVDQSGPRVALADPDRPPAGPAFSMRRVIRLPLAAVLVLAGALAAACGLLVQVLLLTSAASRYESVEAISRFLGVSVVLTGLFGLAGVSLSRWSSARFGFWTSAGLRPAVAVASLLIALLTAVIAGDESPAFLTALLFAAGADVLLRHAGSQAGVSRLSLALPPPKRKAAALALRHGCGPAALAGSAAIILAANRLDEGSAMLIAATLLVAALWSVSGLVALQRFRNSIRRSVRSRSEVVAELRLEEPVTRSIVTAMSRSSNRRDVRRALRVLAIHDDPALDDILDHVAASPSERMRHSVLPQLVEAERPGVRDIAREAAQSDSVRARIEGLRALGRLVGSAHGQPSDTLMLTDAMHDNDGDIRAVALGSLIRRGELVGKEPAVSVLDVVARSTNGRARLTACRTIAEAGRAPSVATLLDLLTDADPRVRSAAASAVGLLDDRFKTAVFDYLEVATDRPDRQRAAILFLSASSGSCSRSLCEDLIDRLGVSANGRADALFAQPAVRDRVVDLLLGAHLEPGSCADRAETGTQLLDNDDVGVLNDMIDVHVEQVETAKSWRSGLQTTVDQQTAARRRVLDALASEVRTAQRSIVKLLSLLYSPDRLKRVAAALDGTQPDDLDQALEDLGEALAHSHRDRIVDALQVRGDAAILRLSNTSELQVTDLVRSVGWSRHPDWLQAAAIALAAEVGDEQDVIGDPSTGVPGMVMREVDVREFVTAGPISRETMAALGLPEASLTGATEGAGN